MRNPESYQENSVGCLYLHKKTGLLIYMTENGTFVDRGISFLVPVKKEWILWPIL
ncbi:MAG: hypothetical protein PHY05_09355 [Methanothrix sp.]|nr:hypothetical protein [Methanothrix sp.]